MARQATLPIEEFAKAMGVNPKDLKARYEQMEAQDLAALEKLMNGEETRRPFEARALSQGGRLGARIPEKLFWNLWFKEGFGLQQMLDAQDLSEVERMYPQVRVETVSDRLTVGYTGLGQRGGRWGRRRGVKFDVAVNFAK